MKKNIYELRLHEDTVSPDGKWIITRVPGGWIYAKFLFGGNVTLFVPWDREFQSAYEQKADEGGE